MDTDSFEISPYLESLLQPFEPASSRIMPLESQTEINCEDLIRLFDELFVPSVRTRLCGGGDEPIYLPADSTRHLNEIHFTRDYSASALHEIAHWCVAGPQRLKEVDFGYWYAPDGRSPAQQQEFEHVEVKPQALEWIFSVACGARFRVSADNLAQGLGPSAEFKRAVVEQAQLYIIAGLPVRASQWMLLLSDHYQVPNPLHPGHYRYEYLGE